jgi:hypothetical protein
MRIPARRAQKPIPPLEINPTSKWELNSLSDAKDISSLRENKVFWAYFWLVWWMVEQTAER